MPGPIAAEVVKALSNPEHPIGTFPAQAPPGTPPPTAAPVYQVSNPNSWLGMAPWAGKLLQGGMAGVVALAFWLLLQNMIANQGSSQKTSDANQLVTQTALIEAFKDTQKERAAEARELTQGLLRTQIELQGEIKGLTRAIEKMSKQPGD